VYSVLTRTRTMTRVAKCEQLQHEAIPDCNLQFWDVFMFPRNLWEQYWLRIPVA
jgi:hypothetical protein